jgi:5-methylcytosine-specific restriction protein A
MPSRPNRPCNVSGCLNLTTARYCDTHAADRDVVRSYDRFRGTAASRGYDADWTKVRLHALERDRYLCLHCLSKDLVTLAVDVDHIIPISVDPRRRLDLENLQSLCRPCHRKKTATERL